MEVTRKTRRQEQQWQERLCGVPKKYKAKENRRLKQRQDISVGLRMMSVFFKLNTFGDEWMNEWLSEWMSEGASRLMNQWESSWRKRMCCTGGVLKAGDSHTRRKTSTNVTYSNIQPTRTSLESSSDLYGERSATSHLRHDRA